MTTGDRDRAGDRWVLLLIGGGIVFTVNFIIFTVWRASVDGRQLPDMAEVIFGAIIGGSLVKIADVLSALVTLASSRQSEKLTDQLATSAPLLKPAPANAQQAADQVANAAEAAAQVIRDNNSNQSDGRARS